MMDVFNEIRILFRQMSDPRRLLLERITVNSGILDGKPVIREKWLTVEEIMGFLAAGASHEDILEIHPCLEREDILACLTYAYFEIAHRLPPERFNTRNEHHQL